MIRRNLLIAILGLISISGVSVSLANSYSVPAARLVSDLPYRSIMPVEPILDPVPGVEPSPPVSDLPIRSILPVEPIVDPAPVIEPKGPISDQPVRNIIPVEPGIDPGAMRPPAVVDAMADPVSAVVEADPIPVRPVRSFYRRGRNVAGDGRSVNRPWPNVSPSDPKRMSDEPIPMRPVRRGAGQLPIRDKVGISSQVNNRIFSPIIVPNPIANQRARVSFQSSLVPGDEVRASVYDLSGKLVESRSMQASAGGVYNVDLGRLSNGAYVLRLSAPGVDAAQKIVVQR